MAIATVPVSPLTNGEHHLLTFLIKYRREHRFSPTYREIGRALRVPFTTVAGRVRKLEHKKWLKRVGQGNRSLVLLATPKRFRLDPVADAALLECQLPTPSQLRLLDWITAYIAKHGRAPTLEEIGAGLQIHKMTVHDHLVQLRCRGYLRWRRCKARSLRVLRQPSQSPRSHRAARRTA